MKAFLIRLYAAAVAFESSNRARRVIARAYALALAAEKLATSKDRTTHAALAGIFAASAVGLVQLLAYGHLPPAVAGIMISAGVGILYGIGTWVKYDPPAPPAVVSAGPFPPTAVQADAGSPAGPPEVGPVNAQCYCGDPECNLGETA